MCGVCGESGEENSEAENLLGDDSIEEFSDEDAERAVVEGKGGGKGIKVDPRGEGAERAKVEGEGGGEEEKREEVRR